MMIVFGLLALAIPALLAFAACRVAGDADAAHDELLRKLQRDHAPDDTADALGVGGASDFIVHGERS